MNKAKRMRPLLGTFVEVGAHSTTDVAPALDAAFHAIEKIQALLSFHDPGSDLSKLNAAQGGEVVLHPLSARVLRLAQAMTRASGGRFNCTVGGTLVQKQLLPDHGFAPYLSRGEADDLIVQGRKAKLRRPVLVTLDGLAKGYAVDCAIRALQQRGASAGWVNAGGDLRVFGDLVLPVQRREEDGRMTLLGGLRNAALASSGARSKPSADFPGWIVGEAGAPAIGMWSVMARTAWRADALTKVACVAAHEEREGVVRRLGGRLVEGVAT